MKITDISGQKFGRWLVTSYSGHGKWNVVCDCGKTKELLGKVLRRGLTKSCGCLREDTKHNPRTPRTRPTSDLTGMTFGYLTVVEFDDMKRTHNGARRSYWWCDCICGNRVSVYHTALCTQDKKSCGCLSHPKGRASKNWKGQPKKTMHGYVLIPKPEQTFAKVRTNGYVTEHIHVLTQHLNRPLFPRETVHHKNGIRDDNRLENLELWSSSQPSGQRVEDKIQWATDYLQQHGYTVTKCLS